MNFLSNNKHYASAIVSLVALALGMTMVISGYIEHIAVPPPCARSVADLFTNPVGSQGLYNSCLSKEMYTVFRDRDTWFQELVARQSIPLFHSVRLGWSSEDRNGNWLVVYILDDGTKFQRIIIFTDSEGKVTAVLV